MSNVDIVIIPTRKEISALSYIKLAQVPGKSTSMQSSFYSKKIGLKDTETL